MLEITKYIKDLLFLHDCVILPGFGGFVANYRSAQVDESRNIFLPPSKDIGFNRNLTQNDGLLINRLIEAEKMSYQEAEKSISFFVEDLWVRIHRGERVVLEGVGSLFHDKRFNLLFEPQRETNFLVDALGMDDVKLPILTSVTSHKDNIPIIDLESVKSFFTPRKIRYAALAIPVLAILTLLPLKSEREGGVSFSSLNPVKAIKENSAVVEQTAKPEVSDPSEFVRYEPKIDEEVEAPKGDKFYLIAGSFVSLDNAKVLEQELKARTYPAQIIRNKDLYSVAINTFDSHKAANRFKRKVIGDNPKASCWILKK